MTPGTLEASLRSDRPSAESTLGLALPDDWFAERPLMALRREAGRADPEYRPWSLRAIALAASGAMIGHIGIHTRPDPEYLRTFVADAVATPSRRCAPW